MTYPKKLIEVALPLPEINDASAYDKMPGIWPLSPGMGGRFERNTHYSRESLEGKHLTLVTGRPLGTLDPYGQYSINVAALFTANGGLQMAQPVSEGAILTVMAGTRESVAAAGREALRKALLRGSIKQAAAVLVFSCCLRAAFLGDRLVEETRGMQQILPDVPITGFYSMGEQGLADDGVNRNNTEVIAVLVLGRELSYAAKVALEREGLRREVQQAEALKVAYAALEREVDERQKAEETLKSTVAFLENVIDSSVDPLGTVDACGRFTRWNQAAAETYGYSAAGLAVHNAFELYPDKAALKKMLVQLRRDGFIRGYEIDMQKKDKVIAPFSLSIRLLRDENGKSLGSVGVARDLTETRKALTALGEANAKLQWWRNQTGAVGKPILLPAWRNLFNHACMLKKPIASLRNSPKNYFPDSREPCLSWLLLRIWWRSSPPGVAP